ncbi:MAG TPA: SDR family oxidoreductase [Polyangium sp.]|nr:SDR family oxidoreductase [Polyangium sp.]
MIVIVSGAAGALGSALVAHFIASGASVAAVDVPQAAGRMQTLADQFGRAYLPVPLDVLDPNAWNQALSMIEEKLGAPDGAALLAGGFTWTGPMHAAKDDAWDAMMNMNAGTVHASLRALLPGMVARRKGSIVAVGSRASVQPSSGGGMAAYTASKAAVTALVQAIAAEVLEHGVRVNAVLPSVIDTPRNRIDMPNIDFSKWVTPESLAGVISFLLSDAGKDISGALVPVYGRV